MAASQSPHSKLDRILKRAAIKPSGDGPFPHEPLDAPTVIIARHGETKLNKKTVTKGWIDEPLDADGKQQAEELGKELSRFPITHILSSSLDRAQETSSIINEHLGADVKPSHDMLPWNPGVYAGTKGAQGLKIVQHYTSHPDDTPPQGESYNQFLQRFAPVLHGAMEHAKAGNVPLLLGHSRHIQSLGHILSHGKLPILAEGGAEPGTAVMLQNRGNGWQLANPNASSESNQSE